MTTTNFQIQLYIAAAGVGWRLLSGNNRVIGRNALSFASEVECRRAIGELQRQVAGLRGQVRRRNPNHWIWEVHRDGQPVAIAGHPFDRLIRCEQALAAFVEGFADAPVAAVLTDSGSRRWRASIVAEPSAVRMPGRRTRAVAPNDDVA
jgi:hypothetical protein